MHETIGICPICKEEKVKFVRLDFNIYQYECRRCGWIKIQEVSVENKNLKDREIKNRLFQSCNG